MILNANGQMITLSMLLSLCPAIGTSAAIDWSQITLYSHPGQKKLINQTVLHISREDDGLDTLKAFWDNIKWETPRDYPTNIIRAYIGGEIVGEVSGLHDASIRGQLV